MSFIKKLHNVSLHALGLCAVITLASLAVNLISALCLFIADHTKK